MKRQNLTYTILKHSGFLSSTLQNALFISKFHNSRSLLGVGYFTLEQSPCKSSKPDYIEVKTTTGGKVDGVLNS